LVTVTPVRVMSSALRPVMVLSKVRVKLEVVNKEEPFAVTPVNVATVPVTHLA